MRAKERVRLALNHQEPDRVPMNYHADGGTSERLKAHFGIEGSEARKCFLTSNEDPRLLAALDCDLRTVVPDYAGPPIRQNPDGSIVVIFGEHLLVQENADGSAYFLYPHHPLAEARTKADVDAHPWPSVDWFDFSSIGDQLDEWEDYAIIAGDMGTLDLISRTMMLVGHERVMLGMLERDPVILRIFEHIADFYYAYMKRLLEACRGRADIAYYGEDLGTQGGPRISPALYRELIQPHWRRHIELACRHGCVVMQHSCGSNRAFYPLMIETGVGVHDTVQVEAAGMDAVEIKREFGDRLAFHGGISIQQVLQTATPEAVAEEVRRVIRALAPDGGYILAPTHWIQGGTPVENVLTMYRTAKEFSTEFYALRRKGCAS